MTMSLSIVVLILLFSTVNFVFAGQREQFSFIFNDIQHQHFDEKNGWFHVSSASSSKARLASSLSDFVEVKQHYVLLCEHEHPTIDVESIKNDLHFVSIDHHEHTHFAKVIYDYFHNVAAVSKDCLIKKLDPQHKIASSISEFLRHNITTPHLKAIHIQLSNDNNEQTRRNICNNHIDNKLIEYNFSYSCLPQGSDPLTITIIFRYSLQLSPMNKTQNKNENNKNNFKIHRQLRQFLVEHLINKFPRIRRIDVAHSPRFLNDVASITTQTTDAEYQSKNFHPVWSRGLTGKGHLVAVADTGIDYDHCSFDDAKEVVAFWPKVNKNHRKIYSYRECVNAQHQATHGDSYDAHGTHVAATIAGSEWPTNTNYEQEAKLGQYTHGDAQRFRGMAPDAKLFFFDLTCGADQSLAIPHDPYDVFLPAAEAGAEVHSNSWGFPWSPREYEASDRRTDRFAFDFPNVLVFFAAGNDPNTGVLTPATSKNVLTIGAHNNAYDRNIRDMMAGFSAHGPPFYGNRFKPEISAPGASVNSAKSDGNLGSHNCGFVAKSGTSMATPVAAGSSILVKQYFEEGFYPDGVRRSRTAENGTSQNFVKLSATGLKAAMVTAAYPLRGTSQNNIPNMNQGYGGLNLAELLRFHDDSSKEESPIIKHLAVFDQISLFSSPSSSSSFSSSSFTEIGGDPYKFFCIAVTTPLQNKNKITFRDFLRISMVYHDPPLFSEGTSSSSSSSFFNDLDLLLTNPLVNGSDGFHISAVSSPTTKFVSNSEQIVLSNAPPSSSSLAGKFFFNIAIRGKRLLTSYQNFSVVALGLGIEIVNDHGSCTPSHIFPSSSAFPTLRCPNDCHHDNGGRGQCDTSTGICKCHPFFKGIDCSECNSKTSCNGRGSCEIVSGVIIKCKCIANAEEGGTTQSPSPNPSFCSSCKSGFTGPFCSMKSSCDPNVDCYGGKGGACVNNRDTPDSNVFCTCFDNDQQGHFDSMADSNCRVCSFDYTQNVTQTGNLISPSASTGTAATPQLPLCTTKTHWCLNRQTRLIELSTPLEPQFIQINDMSAYQNSMTCTWRIQPSQELIAAAEKTSSTYVIRITFFKFDIENKFDTVSIYDFTLEQEKTILGSQPSPPILTKRPLLPTDIPIAVVTGNNRPPQTTTKSEVMVVEFESDFLGPGFGFLAKVETLRRCESTTCHGKGVCDKNSGTCTCLTKNFDESLDCRICKNGWKGSQCDEADSENRNNNTATSSATTSTPTSTHSGSGDDNKKYRFASECYTSEGIECSGNGVCDDERTGRCKCNALYRGFLCDKPCPTHNGILCGPPTEQGTTSESEGAKCEFSETSNSALCVCPPGITGKSCQIKESNVVVFNPIYSASAGVLVRSDVIANGNEAQEGQASASTKSGSNNVPPTVVRVMWPRAVGGSKIYITIYATPAVTTTTTTTSTATSSDQTTSSSSSSSSTTSKSSSKTTNSAFLIKLWHDWSTIGILRPKTKSEEDQNNKNNNGAFQIVNENFVMNEPDDEILFIDSGPRCFVVDTSNTPRAESSSSTIQQEQDFVEFGLTFYSQSEKLNLVISATSPNIGSSLIPIMDYKSGKNLFLNRNFNSNKNKVTTSSGDSTTKNNDNTNKKIRILETTVASCETDLVQPYQMIIAKPKIDEEDNSGADDDQLLAVPLSNIAVIFSVGIVTMMVGGVLAAAAFFLWSHSIKKSRARRRHVRRLESSDDHERQGINDSREIIYDDENNSKMSTSAIGNDDDDDDDKYPKGGNEMENIVAVVPKVVGSKSKNNSRMEGTGMQEEEDEHD